MRRERQRWTRRRTFAAAIRSKLQPRVALGAPVVAVAEELEELGARTRGRGARFRPRLCRGVRATNHRHRVEPAPQRSAAARSPAVAHSPESGPGSTRDHNPISVVTSAPASEPSLSRPARARCPTVAAALWGIRNRIQPAPDAGSGGQDDAGAKGGRHGCGQSASLRRVGHSPRALRALTLEAPGKPVLSVQPARIPRWDARRVDARGAPGRVAATCFERTSSRSPSTGASRSTPSGSTPRGTSSERTTNTDFMLFELDVELETDAGREHDSGTHRRARARALPGRVRARRSGAPERRRAGREHDGSVGLTVRGSW